MKSVVHSSLIALENPEDYEARSNIMWTATWALNTLLSRAKTTDWMVHMLGQAAGAHTDATHGMTLAAVSLPYYRYLIQSAAGEDAGPTGEACIAKFARFATEVWKVSPDGRSEEELAYAGLEALESWMKELGLVMNLTELGASGDMVEGIADSTIILKGGYKVLTKDEVAEILRQSL